MPATMRTSSLDDIDAITPCPPVSHSQQQEDQIHAYHDEDDLPAGFHLPTHAGANMPSCASSVDMGRSTRSSSPTYDFEHPGMMASANRTANSSRRSSAHCDSVRALEEGTENDPARLWRRMLALQQHYGCYRSARMSAALESGDSSLLLPSKACLDMMNADMATLPEEAEQVIEGWRARIRNKVRRGGPSKTTSTTTAAAASATAAH